jgi:hypothetical protein
MAKKEEIQQVQVQTPVAEIKSFSEKLLAAYSDLSYIQKTGFNKAQNYKFLKSEDVLKAVNATLLKNRLILSKVDFEPVQVSVAQQPLTDSQKNIVYSPKGDIVFKNQNLVTLKAHLEIADADSDNTIRASGVGQGIDPTDKASAKAMTIALKYALTSLFLIASGDDPESDEQSDKDASAGDYQKAKPAAQPSTTTQSQPGKVCTENAKHGNMKLIPSGIYKDSHPKAGQKYNAFYACQTQGCRGRAFSESPKSTPVPPPPPVQQAQPEIKGGDDETPF